MKTILISVLLGLLTACGGGGDDDPQPSEETPKTNCQANPGSCK